ncbi:MAG: GMP/IMP nucleotidase [Magnetococcus sp. DMHC-6]
MQIIEHKNGLKAPPLPWNTIQTVLLDMDGTLLDLNFDNVFFLEAIPAVHAQRHNLSLQEAKESIFASYNSIKGTLDWYDLNFWAATLDLNIVTLHRQTAHLIRMHDHTLPFLTALRHHAYPTHLVTNAHLHSLALKLSRTPIGEYFDSITSCFHLGVPKENVEFWSLFQQKIGFDPTHTLLIDDSEPVLHAAKQFGITHLRHINTPSSCLPPKISDSFYSISDLSAVMPSF